MNRPARSTGILSLLLACLLLQFHWAAGFGVHTVCLESDGGHHMEWSGSGCGDFCAGTGVLSAPGQAGPTLRAGADCIDCTDIAVAHAGLRTHGSSSAPPCACLQLPRPLIAPDAHTPAPGTRSAGVRAVSRAAAPLPLRC